MAIIVPKDGDQISAGTFGKPVADQLNASGRGRIASSVYTLDQGSISDVGVYLNGFDLSWTSTETRTYRIEFIAQPRCASVTTWIFQIDVDGVASIVWRFDLAAANQSPAAVGWLVGQWPAGTHRARVKASSSPAWGEILSNSSNNGRFVVTDIGP